MSTQLPLFAPETDWTPPSEFPNLSDAKIIGLDIETRDPNLMEQGPGDIRKDGYVVGVSLSVGHNTNWYFPVAHEGGGNMDQKMVFRYLSSVLKRPDLTKVGANLKYDICWLKSAGVEIEPPYIDVQVAEALIDENRGSYALGSLGWKYFKEWKNEDLLKEAAQAYGVDPKSGLWALPAGFVGPYAEWDAEGPLMIWQKQQWRLSKDQLETVCNLEMDLIPMLVEMRMTGVPVNESRAEQLYEELMSDAKQAQDQLNSITGMHVDVWSATSLAEAYGSRSIRHPYTERGNPSFTAEWLGSSGDELSPWVIKSRRSEKAARDFVKAAILGNAVNGRIHAEFNQTRKDDKGTVSGRFSSNNPNLQQVPARDEDIGPRIRSCFRAEPNTTWLCGDYSQQEPRVTINYAELLKLPGAEDAGNKFRSDPATDYHSMVAEFADIPRVQAKTINLGAAYGMGVAKICRELGVDEQRGREIWNQYHERIPYVRSLAEFCMNRAQARGYVKTLLGRRRHFDQWEPATVDSTGSARQQPLNYDAAKKRYGEPLRRAFTYKALNAIIQGSSADMIKQAMLDCYRAGYLPGITVHDELDFYNIENPEQITEIKEIMEHAIELTVPLKVDMKLGPNWGDMKLEGT